MKIRESKSKEHNVKGFGEKMKQSRRNIRDN
jgi:hypothetical protein